MTRTETLMVVLAGIAMITAGLTWMFGPWGLIGPGIFLVVCLPAVMDSTTPTTTEKESTDG